jgi:quercetin 2,3-dioxygenase
VLSILKHKAMKKRSIEVVVAPREAHYVGDGFRVHNFIPGGYHLDMERMNPFIMMDYNSKFYFPPSDKPRGVSVHPHRGFETVTIAYKGKVAHHDSTGNSGLINEGDVQWMTAASGILHKEYHEENFSKAGGDFQMVQLWVNLPAKDKMSEPKYQSLTNAGIGKYSLADNRGEIEVIAGQYKDVKGAASTFSPVNLLNVKLKKDAKESFSFPENFNTALLVVEGSVRVNDAEVVPSDHFVLFENDGEEFTVEAGEDAIVLILSGEPINEPIAAHGPFVMNTEQEIKQAFEDFRRGKFGKLEE